MPLSELPETAQPIAGFPDIGWRVVRFPCLPSTNDYLLERAGDSANDGLAVVADHQTLGRGQHGRVWQSAPRSSLLLSVLIFPTPALTRPALLTAWAAVSVGRTIRALTGAEPQMKWPNDLLLAGKKCCGILIERRGGTVVGIGLNLAQTEAEFAQAGLPHATSLAAFAGRPAAWEGALHGVLDELDAEYRRMRAGDFRGLEADWRRMLGLEGERVALERSDGTVVEGRLTQLRLDGLAVDGVAVAPETVRHIWRV